MQVHLGGKEEGGAEGEEGGEFEGGEEGGDVDEEGVEGEDLCGVVVGWTGWG